MVPGTKTAAGTSITERALSSAGSWPRPAWQAQGEGEADQGQGGEHEHHRREAIAVGKGAEDWGADASEAYGEAHRYAGCDPDPSRQILLAHHHRDAERAYRSRPDEGEEDHPRKRSREGESVDQGSEKEHRPQEHGAPPDPVGKRSHGEGARGAGEEHHREGRVCKDRRGAEHLYVVGGDERDEPEVHERAHDNYPYHSYERPPV